MSNKSCCFAGHRDEFYNIGIEDKLLNVIEELINKGYTIFYDGDYGCFDKLSRQCVLKLKKQYPHIQLIYTPAFYQHDANKFILPPYCDDFIMPDIEFTFYKARITARNKWIVDRCDIVVCHIEHDDNSGAFNTIKYAQKINKPIIYI